LSFDAKFLRVLGFGKDESEWITEYDSWEIEGGFRSKYTLVGRGQISRMGWCGKHKCYYKCDAVDLHTGVFAGKDIFHNQVNGCHRPSWKYDWAVLGGRNIEDRFLTAEKVLGLPIGDVEHLSASVPKSERDLPYDELCRRAILMLKLSGVFGGVIMFHGHRKNREIRKLVYSPHFHTLGYIKGGYDRCRDCVKQFVCWECDGFEGVTRRAHKQDGWIVGLAKNEKGVVEKRNTVFGSSWYQLEHSSIKVGASQFRVYRWFGVLGNRKLKTVRRGKECLCPHCKSPMHLGYPDGAEPIICNRGERGFLKNFAVDHVDHEEDEPRFMRRRGGGRVGED
jgi:hypothetical protein